MFNCPLKILIPTKVTTNWPSTVDLIKSVFKQTPIDFLRVLCRGKDFIIWSGIPAQLWHEKKPAQLVTVIILFFLAKQNCFLLLFSH